MGEAARELPIENEAWDFPRTDYWIAPDEITVFLQRRQKTRAISLWVKGDSRPFRPRVSNTVYGDGRALFYFGTCMDRPYWWLVRGDSTWTTSSDEADGPGLPFSYMTDRILTDLECEFGNAWDDDGRERKRRLRYPAIVTEGGCHWGREDWPAMRGVTLEPHPLDPHFQILGAPP